MGSSSNINKGSPLSSIKKAITSKVTSVAKSVTSKVSSVASKVIKNAPSFVKSAITNKVNSISNKISSLKTTVATAKSNLASSIAKNGIAGTLKNAAVSVVKAQVGGIVKVVKGTYNYLTTNPTGQRILKGAVGALQAAGGAAMVATGAALCGTGLGAILGAPMIAFGASNIIQGSANVALAVIGSNAVAPNPLQEVTKYVGYKLTGESGAAVAGKVYTPLDFGLGMASGGGVVSFFSKANKVAELANVARNFTTGVGQVVKGAVTIVKNLGAVAKYAINASVQGVKTVRYSTTAAGSALMSGANKLATSFTTTLGKIGQATKAGLSEYSAVSSRMGIVYQSPTVEGLTAAISKYKELSAGVDDVIKSGSYSSFRDLMSPEEATRYSKYWNDKITSIPKGSRPDPSTYLDKAYIDAHLAKFDDGASIIMTEQNYDKFVLGNKFIGIPEDGTQFVLPKNICDGVAVKANGNVSVYEEMLGFDKGHFSKGGGLVRIDINDTSNLNLRIPSGNEFGANNHWLPGGYTDGGVPEAISDLIPNTPDKINITQIKQ